MTDEEFYAFKLLYKACENFVSKVDAGLAKSTKSYGEMITALARSRIVYDRRGYDPELGARLERV